MERDTDFQGVMRKKQWSGSCVHILVGWHMSVNRPMVVTITPRGGLCQAAGDGRRGPSTAGCADGRRNGREGEAGGSSTHQPARGIFQPHIVLLAGEPVK